MYATIADMVSRYGEGEMIRLSVADGPLPEAVVPARIEEAIRAASATIDSYLRKRHQVPIAGAPADVMTALADTAAVIARYALALGGDREPSEQMWLARKDKIAWLEAIAAGRVTLDGVPLVAATGGGARVSDRAPVFDGSEGLV